MKSTSDVTILMFRAIRQCASNMRLLVVVLLLSTTVYRADVDGEPSQCDEDTEFACENKRICIPLELVNNTINDCEDNSDEVAIPCKRPLFSCGTYPRCAMMGWVLDGEDDCLDGTDEAKLIGTNCSKAVDCCFCDVYVSNSKCVDELCQCNEGYYPNQLRNACIPRMVGDECSSMADCLALKGGFCGADGRCSCPPGHFTDNFVCTQRQLGDTCSTDDDCNVAIELSVCDDVTMTCRCNVTAGYLPNMDGICEIRELGDDCMTDVDCDEAIEHSQCMIITSNVDTLIGTCVCRDGFRQVGLLQCRYYVLGESCTKQLQCKQSINNSRCLEGYCSCLPGYRDVVTALQDTCIRRVIGDPCHVNTDCSDVIQFSVCVHFNSSAICRCDEEHWPADDGSFCDIRTTLKPYVPVDGPQWDRCGLHGTCEGFNERCVAIATSDVNDAEHSSSSSSSSGFCRCIGGFSRRGLHEPCRRARSLEVRLNCSRIAGRFDYLPLLYWNYLEDINDVQQIRRQERDYSTRLQYSGMDVILSESSTLQDKYLTSHVVQLDDAVPGLKVTFAVYLDTDSNTEPQVLETVLRDFLNRSDGEVGVSRIFVERPFEDNLLVSDLNECQTWKMSARLHDCHDNASCGNEPGYFDCVCNLNFRDNSTDRDYPGRHCIAFDKKKDMEAQEHAIRTAGCTDGTCETSWDIVMIITSCVFSLLLVLLTIELIWRTRQLRKEVVKKQQKKSAGSQSTKPAAYKRDRKRLTAIGSDATTPLLTSDPHSLSHTKNARTRKSPGHDNLRRPLVNADEDFSHPDSDTDR